MKQSGLYIHVPFCTSKCPYCGFYSIASASLIPGWLLSLKKEISLYGDISGTFDSLYFGGGTPSILELGDIEGIMDCLVSTFRFCEGTEITIEANPGDMTLEKIRGLKSMGFNRINLGVQSFDDRDLRFLGRRHNAQEAKNALTSLRSSGINNIGMDLMYGLNGQSIDRWMNTLEKALLFRPEHISCYQLSIEEKTPFERMEEKGIIKSPGEDKEEFFFLETSRFLENHGYLHYEISNFARRADFRSRHNRKYWEHIPYLGLGPSAHSFKNNKRWWNYRSVKRYCKELEAGYLPVEGHEKLNSDQRMMEIISLGLRTSRGVGFGEIKNLSRLDNTIQQLMDEGLINIRDQRVIPTKKGFLVADHLPLSFTG